MPLGAQVYALTFVHSAFTMVGMWLFAAFGMFEVKRLAARQARTRPCQRAGPAFVSALPRMSRAAPVSLLCCPCCPPRVTAFAANPMAARSGGGTLLYYLAQHRQSCTSGQAASASGAERLQVFPLAAAFVGYVVLWNLSLQLNPVGFYQLAKILIAPAVIAIEASFYAKRPTRNEMLAVCVLCVGVTMATVTDDQARSPRRPRALPRARRLRRLGAGPECELLVPIAGPCTGAKMATTTRPPPQHLLHRTQCARAASHPSSAGTRSGNAAGGGDRAARQTTAGAAAQARAAGQARTRRRRGAHAPGPARAGGHQPCGPDGRAAGGVLHGGVPDLGGLQAEGAGRGQHAADAPVRAARDRAARGARAGRGAARAARPGRRRVRPRMRGRAQHVAAGGQPLGCTTRSRSGCPALKALGVLLKLM